MKKLISFVALVALAVVSLTAQQKQYKMWAELSADGTKVTSKIRKRVCLDENRLAELREKNKSLSEEWNQAAEEVKQALNTLREFRGTYYAPTATAEQKQTYKSLQKMYDEAKEKERTIYKELNENRKESNSLIKTELVDITEDRGVYEAKWRKALKLSEDTQFVYCDENDPDIAKQIAAQRNAH